MLVLGHARHSSGWQKRPLVKVSSRTHFLTRPQQDLKSKNVYCGFSHRFSLIKKKLEFSRSSLLSAMYVRWIHSIVCNGASPAAQDRLPVCTCSRQPARALCDYVYPIVSSIPFQCDGGGTKSFYCLIFSKK